MNQVLTELKKYVIPEKAAFFPKFFKTGPGEYGEGDKFLGVTVPNMRLVAIKFKDLSLKDLNQLLDSEIHEERMVALFILVMQYSKGAPEKKQEIYEFYLSKTSRINNWDLVDCSAHKIVGAFLFDKDRKILYQLAKSPMLWERRIAIVATFYFIQRNQLEDTTKLSEILLNDKQDLMHKAVGWMLREVGKKSEKTLMDFLNKHAQTMPRTALRYSIEKFSPEVRKKYLEKRSKII